MILIEKLKTHRSLLKADLCTNTLGVGDIENNRTDQNSKFDYSESG